MHNPVEGRIGSKLNMGTVYERPVLVDAYRQGLKGSAFDVGAHIGNHALWYSQVCGLKVYAWEPYEESRLQLIANVGLNDADITVYEWGAGDRDTVGRFTPGMWLEFDPTRNGAAMKLDRGEVEVHRIDDHLDVDDLALVKIDIEGMEPQALAGMVQHLKMARPVVYTEVHTAEAWEAQREILRPLGYRNEKVIQNNSRVVRWKV